MDALDNYHQNLDKSLLCKRDLTALTADRKLFATKFDEESLADYEMIRSKVSNLSDAIQRLVKEDTKYQLDNITEDNEKSVAELLARKKPLVLLHSGSFNLSDEFQVKLFLCI